MKDNATKITLKFYCATELERIPCRGGCLQCCESTQAYADAILNGKATFEPELFSIMDPENKDKVLKAVFLRATRGIGHEQQTTESQSGHVPSSA